MTACPYIEESVGDIREGRFAQIWAEAPMFAALRKPELEGKCGVCEYTHLCGGCRARPLARDGNLMGEDFLCGYEPGGGAVIAPMPKTSSNMPWSDEAQQRLLHVPAFVRRFVKRRAEDFARQNGEGEVLAAHLDELARRRFGGNMPFTGRGKKKKSGT
jgi:radical SAM protein with 4Fe4S-binding SPASM domain